MDDFEKPKRRPQFDPNDFPCPVCGQADYVWGLTVGEGPTQRLYIRPDESGWGEGKILYTRECLSCGNVLMFTRKGSES
jgi:predicted RNA-binding Zn-ribbon protein involved in translation (DUF1610 family)